MKKIIGICLFCLVITGCSSSNIKPLSPNELDLTPYVNDYVEKCLPSNSAQYCKNGEVNCKAAVTLCTNHGERAAEVARSYFPFEPDFEAMKAKCAQDTQCFLDYQKRVYDIKFKRLTEQFNSK